MSRHYGSILLMPKKALAGRFCKKARKGRQTQKACVRTAMKKPVTSLIKGIFSSRVRKTRAKRR